MCKRVHLDTTTGTPDLSGSGPCDISLCRINPAFRLAFPSLWVVVSRCTLCERLNFRSKSNLMAMKTRYPLLLGVLSFLLSCSTCDAEIKIAVDHNQNEHASGAFTFKNVPFPSKTDSAT